MIYKPTIGLEVHTELKTKTKMFCGCLNSSFSNPSRMTSNESRIFEKNSRDVFDENSREPNVNVCPICLAHPGTLPVINKKAVEAVLKLGLALGSKIPETSKFDRKNYFYPDLPKGYQISQHDKPLVIGGELNGVRIIRVHLEEDAGRLVHSADGKSSLVDFNRAGLPLMELVTEPDIKSGKQAVDFAQELQLIMRYLDISDADMEKGQMRVEVNISLSNLSRMNSNGPRIILKDRSYDLMGLLFEVHNKLGSIYKEKNYQDAIEEILKREKIEYEREKNVKLKFENLEISDFFIDFVIENKIALEIKAKPFITENDIRQANRYIKSLNLPLAIIVNFKRQKLEFKRVINPAFENDSSLFEENSRNTLGTKVEIKNLNSFRAVGESIDYEIKRQSEILEKGEAIKQETRGWDDIKKRTISQRSKEEAHDYRYFPEPDLTPMDLTTSDVVNLENLKIELPELPAQKRERFIKEYNLDEERAEILVSDRYLAEYFEESVSELVEEIGDKNRNIELLFNYLSSDIKGLINEQGSNIKKINITPENFADLIVLISKAEISSRSAKDILKEMFLTGLDPRRIIEKKGLKQVSDEEPLKRIVEGIIKENPKAIEDYKKGKVNALQFMIGQAMAKLKGKGNPDILRKLFLDLLTK